MIEAFFKSYYDALGEPYTGTDFIGRSDYGPFHLACDTFDNISLEALDVNSDAVASATLNFAMSTTAINGVPGKGNFSDRNAMAQLERLGSPFQR